MSYYFFFKNSCIFHKFSQTAFKYAYFYNFYKFQCIWKFMDHPVECIGIFNIIFYFCKIRYTFVEPPDKQFGRRLPSGEWTGLIGQLARGVSKLWMITYTRWFKMFGQTSMDCREHYNKQCLEIMVTIHLFNQITGWCIQIPFLFINLTLMKIFSWNLNLSFLFVKCKGITRNVRNSLSYVSK